MALITVTLRIVGIYFNEPVIIDDAPGPLTVKNVLDEYIRIHPDLSVAGGLEYIRFPFEKDGKDFIKTFNYNYPGIYNYDGNDTLVVATDPEKPTIVAPDGHSLGKQPRTEGIYTLSEDFEDQFNSKKIGLVWQYYIISKDGINKSKTPVSRGFKPFGATPPIYLLEDGDVITWRLVGICREPNFAR